MAAKQGLVGRLRRLNRALEDWDPTLKAVGLFVAVVAAIWGIVVVRGEEKGGSVPTPTASAETTSTPPVPISAAAQTTAFTPTTAGTPTTVKVAPPTIPPQTMARPSGCEQGRDGSTDLPGPTLSIGTCLEGVFNDLPAGREAYTVDLSAGQTLQLDLWSKPSGCVYLLAPGSQSVDKAVLLVEACGSGEHAQLLYTAADAGSYPLFIYGSDTVQTYALAVSEGEPRPALGGGVDFPGAELTLGRPIESVLDGATRPRETYAIVLAEGASIRIRADVAGGCLYLMPKAATRVTTDLEPLAEQCVEAGGNTISFTATEAGTYPVFVYGTHFGQRYSIVAEATS